MLVELAAATASARVGYSAAAAAGARAAVAAAATWQARARICLMDIMMAWQNVSICEFTEFAVIIANT